jgi:hypothetical protein
VESDESAACANSNLHDGREVAGSQGTIPQLLHRIDSSAAEANETASPQRTAFAP